MPTSQFKLKSFSLILLFLFLFPILAQAEISYTLSARGFRKIFANHCLGLLFVTPGLTRPQLKSSLPQLRISEAEKDLGLNSLIANGWATETAGALTATQASKDKIVKTLGLYILFPEGRLTIVDLIAKLPIVRSAVTRQMMDSALAQLVVTAMVTITPSTVTITHLGVLDVLDNHILYDTFLRGTLPRSYFDRRYPTAGVTGVEIDLAILDLETRGLLNEV